MPFNPFKVKPIPIHAHSPLHEQEDADDNAVAQHLEEQVEDDERRASNPFTDDQEYSQITPHINEPIQTPLSYQQTPATHYVGHQHYQSMSDEHTPIFTHPQPSFHTSAPSYTGTSSSFDPSSNYQDTPHYTQTQSITPVPVSLPQAHPLAYSDIEKQDDGASYQSRSPSPVDDDSYEGLYNKEDGLTSPAPAITALTPDMDTSHYGAPPEERIRRRGKTKKKIALTDGNLVVDLPIPSTLDKVIMRRDLDDMAKVRYTAVTCDPDHFERNNFTLRQALHNRRTELAICITMYNEDEVLFCRTLYGVMKNISHLCSRKNSSNWGIDAWTKVVVVIVADGRSKVHPRVLDCLASLGVYQEGVAKGAVNDQDVEAHLFEYTTSLALGPDLKFKGPEKRIVPTQVGVCVI